MEPVHEPRKGVVLEELAAGVKSRVSQALKDAGISHREVARRLFGKETDRVKVGEWLRTDRTMPAEFVAWVAIATGESGHFLLTGERGMEGHRLDLIAHALAGNLDRYVVGEVKDGIVALQLEIELTDEPKPANSNGKGG